MIKVDFPYARISLPSTIEANQDGRLESKWIDLAEVVSGYGLSFETWRGEGVWCLATKGQSFECLVYLPGRAWIGDLHDSEYTVHAIIGRDADGMLTAVPYNPEVAA